MSKDIVRQDIVQVSFEIDNPLKELVDVMKNLQKAAESGVEGIDDEFKELKDTAKSTKKGFDDLGKEKFTSLKNALEKVKDKLTDIAKKAGGAAFTALKRLASISFKALATGLAACVTAIGGIVVKSVQAFADFEQLKGGVETLFGTKGAKSVEEYAKLTGKSVDAVSGEYKKLKEAQDTVFTDANNAYKDAGMSANQYMETITTFSAALTNSLGGDTLKSAQLANTAIKDMADNANKMGTPLENVSIVYSNLARGMYMTLDNLKLGYAGTKEGAKQLVNDAAKIDKSIKANDLSYANLVKAIHAVQEKMGITGTTQAEAERTITGSLNSMKSAYQNLLTAIGSGENLDQCFENMISTVEIFGKNVLPVAERALEGIGIVVEKLVPQISEKLPDWTEKLLPPLIKAAVSLFAGLVKALPNIISVIAKEIPNIVKELGTALSEGLGDEFPFIESLGKMFENLGDTLSNNIGKIKKAIPIILGLVGAFKLFKVISSVFGGGGGFFKGLTDMFKSLAKTNTVTILKGMGNLAIILGGFTILAAAFALVAPHIAKLSDAKSILELVAIMAALGTVGAVLAKFAGIVGVIPLTVVLKGLAAIALVITGITAIIAVFGALSKIDGFNDFIKSGGDTLATIFNVIGKIGGSLIGGLGEGISNSLPKIGENIAAFAEALEPMFKTFSNVGDMSGFSTFLKAIGDFMLKMAGSDLASIFTGGTNLTKLATDLTAFAEGSAGFFTSVATFPENGFTNATKLFTCLAGMSALPKEGGLFSLFAGKESSTLTNLATSLSSLATEGVKNFFTMVAGIEGAAFDNATKFFSCLSGMSKLPKEGGLFDLFTGGESTTMSNLATSLGNLATDGVKNFFAMVAGIDPSAFEKTKQMFAALSSMGELPKEGGWWDKLTGTETSTIANLATELSNFATQTQGFFDLVNTANTENLTALSQGITKVSESIANMQEIVETSATAILATFIRMLQGIVTSIDSVDLTAEGSQMINGLIVGMNNKKAAAVATARAIANAINAEYQKVQDIHSPSRVWEEFGAYQIQGNIKGMEANLPLLKATVQQVGDAGRPNTVQQVGDSAQPIYKPEASVTTNNRTVHTTYSPSFTLNMNGASATEANARKVKRMVKEAIKESYAEMSRANPQLLEV